MVARWYSRWARSRPVGENKSFRSFCSKQTNATQKNILVLRHFRGSQICYMPLSMAYARLFEGINIQCYKIKMELKKM